MEPAHKPSLLTRGCLLLLGRLEQGQNHEGQEAQEEDILIPCVCNAVNQELQAVLAAAIAAAAAAAAAALCRACKLACMGGNRRRLIFF